MKQEILLSVIIPSKNEEINIGRCIDSLIACVPRKWKHEIILVDCASTDQTILIAQNYPIKIIQLRPNWIHSAAAARYIGGLYARGEYILFIDADMKLETGFLEEALRVMERTNTLAGVSGIGNEIYVQDGREAGRNPNLYKYKITNAPARVNFLGGAALYRRNPLREIEGFNPYLKAAEEYELAQKLRVKGYTIMSIPVPMITHFTPPIDEWTEFKRKSQAGLFAGIGQALRIAHSPKYFFEMLCYYKEFGVFLIVSVYAAFLILGTLISGNPAFLLGIPLPICILALYLMTVKQNLLQVTISLWKWFRISLDILNGFMLPRRNPAEYPRDPLILQGTFDVEK